MNDYRINLNYAKALFLLSEDLHQTEEVLHDMKLVNAVSRENRQLAKVFGNPVIPEAKKRAIATELFESRLGKTSMAFLLYLIHKRRAVNLEGISNMFMELYRDANNIVLATLTSAVEINPEIVEDIRKDVAEFTHKKVEIDEVVTNRMLGSFMLSFDTYLYDARITTRINRMRREFAKNVYESKL